MYANCQVISLEVRQSHVHRALDISYDLRPPYLCSTADAR